VSAVCFHISGHGFGHASRQIEAINALGALRPDVRIIVRTSAPRWLFERTARTRIDWIPGDVDTGVVQIDSLRLDERATIDRAAVFYAGLAARARSEASLLRSHDARLVIADAPPLSCAAAAIAGVPSFVLSNFTWDWIYEAYADHLAGAPDLIPSIQRAYRDAAAAWRLPMHGGFATFDSVLDIPFIARHARHERAHVRRSLDLPADVPLVLSSFGGYGVDGLRLQDLDCLGRYGVVVTSQDASDGAGPVDRVHVVREADVYDRGLRYEDLVSAVDVVVTKPGYGIIAECLANGTAMLYTARGRFVEYDVLVSEMPRFLRCRFIGHDELFAGRWLSALDEVLGSPPPPEHPPTNGAEVVAGMIAERV
jgi:L-arabinokinase